MQPQTSSGWSTRSTRKTPNGIALRLDDPAVSRGSSAEALGDIGKALPDIAKMLAGTVERLIVIVQTFPATGKDPLPAVKGSPGTGRRRCGVGEGRTGMGGRLYPQGGASPGLDGRAIVLTIVIPIPGGGAPHRAGALRMPMSYPPNRISRHLAWFRLMFAPVAGTTLAV